MEENCQYEIWKNRLAFHTMPCRLRLDTWLATNLRVHYQRGLQHITDICSFFLHVEM